MQPRKLYTTIRVDGITLDCENGINLQFHSQDKVDGFDTAVKMKIFKLISDNIDSFMNNGVDLFVEIDRLPDTSYVVDVLTILKDEDEDADGEEDNEEDEDADGLNSFIELISDILAPVEEDDLDDWDDEDDWE